MGLPLPCARYFTLPPPARQDAPLPDVSIVFSCAVREHRGVAHQSSSLLFLDSPMALCYKPSLWKRFSVL
jgi:hypothetical protein